MNWWQQHLEDTARWLVHMASNPGFADHARHREQELMQDELYADLPQWVRKIRQEQRNEEGRQG